MPFNTTHHRRVPPHRRCCRANTDPISTNPLRDSSAAMYAARAALECTTLSRRPVRTPIRRTIHISRVCQEASPSCRPKRSAPYRSLIGNRRRASADSDQRRWEAEVHLRATLAHRFRQRRRKLGAGPTIDRRRVVQVGCYSFAAAAAVSLCLRSSRSLAPCASGAYSTQPRPPPPSSSSLTHSPPPPT